MKPFLLFSVVAIIAGGGYGIQRASARTTDTCCGPDAAACSGTDSCSACKNCSSCKHCKAGGTCGVCKPKTK